ncbi:MAG: hypothetical protein Q4F29_06590 [Lachnospiraceae bacterium]|nr:hypothetical protein [Lachnospiraceae bacterium]
MGISNRVQKSLEKKLGSSPGLNRETLRWRRALIEVNQALNGGGKKDPDKKSEK